MPHMFVLFNKFSPKLFYMHESLLFLFIFFLFTRIIFFSFLILPAGLITLPTVQTVSVTSNYSKQ